MQFHKHHLIPRHRGGTNHPSNLIKVNIPLHAFLHKQLWLEDGHMEDYIAWQCLSGQITTAEANIMATKNANIGRVAWNKGLKGAQPSTRKGKPRSAEEKQRISEGTKKNMIGVKCGAPKGTVPWNKGLKTG